MTNIIDMLNQVELKFKHKKISSHLYETEEKVAKAANLCLG